MRSRHTTLMTQTQATESPTSTAVQKAGPVMTSSRARLHSLVGRTSSRPSPATTQCLPRPQPKLMLASQQSFTPGHQARTSRNSVQETTCFGSRSTTSLTTPTHLVPRVAKATTSGLVPHQSVQISAQVPRTACASSDGSLLTFRCLRTTIGLRPTRLPLSCSNCSR